jgi:ATP-dependent DNA helicase MPH1
MDSDDFSDGIADEDLLTAFDKGSFSTNDGDLPSSTRSGPSSKVTQTTNAVSASVDLDDLPSDAFSSSPDLTPQPTVRNRSSGQSISSAPRAGLARTGSGVLRQTTLFGTQVSSVASQGASQSQQRSFRADIPREEPTHHEIDKEALQTWVYPTNLGAIRDYQFSIVKNSLFNNTLVALPTGLGKTFIAATVMLNFYRWTKSAQIVFVAPTKPLVAQQIDACYNIAGIPRSDTTLLTGDIPPVLRQDEWAQRRVFFMTPQTLLNDLSHGYADPKRIVLLVIDEAHRSVGEYAYAKVAKFIRRFSQSVRFLALTATPGSKVETVQEVIDNLGISHCEIRTEESIDIRQYVHSRNTNQIILDPSDEMNHVSELFTKALQPLVDKLAQQNIYYGRNPMALTSYGLIQAQKEWFATRGRSANQGLQGMMRAIFSTLTSIAHSIKLLNFHGIKPFYDNMVDMREEQEKLGEKKGGSKYKRQLIQDRNFQEMMDKISMWLRIGDFVGHPKLAALADATLNHFMDHGETTRVIVFSEYRDSAEDIVRTLNKHRPLIKASIFVGQADSKRAEGMKQAQQIATVEKFRKGEFNVLVATSIGEEGLDIGQVDLIVCYDSSSSPIRMLQRMGRTGRKRAGNIVLLLMRGKEEDQFAKSKDNYEKMQKLICEGSRFNFRFDLSRRIVPREIRPEVDKRHVDIPVENTQNTSLPEPKKRRVPAGKKKAPKKFHMPDGVETGFQKLSDFIKTSGKKSTPTPLRNPELEDIATIPPMEKVVLDDDDFKELNRSYRDLPFSYGVVEETAMPSMTAQYRLQRHLRPVVGVKHGRHTKRCVKLLQKMANHPHTLARERTEMDTSSYTSVPCPPFVDSDGELNEVDKAEHVSPSPPPPAPAARKRRAEQTSAGKTKQAGAPKKRKVGKTGGSALPALSNDHEGNDEGDKLEDENVGLTRRLSEKKRKKASTQKGRRTNKANGGINSDELGDDCERESDIMESDGSDDGEDLVGFIVSDNHVISSMPDASSPPSITSDSPAVSRPRTTGKYYVPTEIQATQESDGMPELSVLADVGDDSDGSGRVTGTGRGRAGRSRRQVFDSDSDE